MTSSQLREKLLKRAGTNTTFCQAECKEVIEHLCAIVCEQRQALEENSKRLDAIKYELEASVYTLTDDEFGTVFFVRDMLDNTLASTDARLKKMLGE